MTIPASYHILVVDDDELMAKQVERLLTRKLKDLGSVTFTLEQDFARAEDRLKCEDFDLVVLDVRGPIEGPTTNGEARGRELYERIRAIRWIPVVFFTGVPEQVRPLEEPPLISVVTKNDVYEIEPSVRAGLISGVSALTRRITSLVDRTVRDFMRDVVAPNWNEMSQSDPNEVALVTVNRLAVWLKENGIHELNLMVKDDLLATATQPSAARVYLVPPVTHHLTTADLLVDEEASWWLVLTPACDLHEDHPDVPKPRTAKAQYVRLAKADRVLVQGADVAKSESPIIAKYLGGPRSKSDYKEMEQRAFRVDDNRYRALPKYLDVPHLVVDFENVRSVSLDEARSWKRIATLDSPFAEAMLTAYARSAGRIGTPDVDFQDVQDLLRALPKPDADPTADVPNPRAPEPGVTQP